MKIISYFENELFKPLDDAAKDLPYKQVIRRDFHWVDFARVLKIT